ncbi:MAG: hypothetical protein ACKO8Q_09330 [Bacteroidota bacterium]
MKRNSILLFISVLFFLVACERRRAKDNAVARDAAFGEQLLADVDNFVHLVSSNTDGIRTLNFPCVDTVLVDTLSYPKTITIDFGEDDCFGNDGKNRKGKIHVSYTGRYSQSGTIISISTENYRVDNAQINLVKTVTNEGLNSNSQPYFSVQAEGDIVTETGSISYVSSRIRTWLSGFSTVDFSDDVYDISGSGSGINRNGDPFSVNITNPLRIQLDCAWILSGRIDIEPADGDLRTLDFGSGSCNAGYTILVGDESYAVNGGD